MAYEKDLGNRGGGTEAQEYRQEVSEYRKELSRYRRGEMRIITQAVEVINGVLGTIGRRKLTSLQRKLLAIAQAQQLQLKQVLENYINGTEHPSYKFQYNQFTYAYRKAADLADSLDDTNAQQLLQDAHAQLINNKQSLGLPPKPPDRPQLQRSRHQRQLGSHSDERQSLQVQQQDWEEVRIRGIPHSLTAWQLGNRIVLCDVNGRVVSEARVGRNGDIHRIS